MNKKFQSLLDEYNESHQNQTNKLIHWVCVPLIFWSIIVLLYSIPTSPLIALLGNHFYANWGILVMIPVLIYYLSLSVSIGVGMFLFISSCLYLSDVLLQYSSFPLWVIALIVFALAWVGQFLWAQGGREETILFKRPSVLAHRPSVVIAFYL